jgi:hypothetical protein
MEFFNRCDRIGKALLSKTSNLKEKEGIEKMREMMTAFEDNKLPNAQEKIAGKNIPLRLFLGCLPRWTLGATS